MVVAAGTVIGGDFRLESRLREGGMGEVWIAEQQSIGRRRAVKLMRAELVSDPILRERFALEARIGSTIESDHIVSVIAAGIEEQLRIPWLAMELLQGDDLERSLRDRGPLSWGDARHLSLQLGHALGAAHAVNVVHRDLKPDNIFLAKSRRSGDSPFDVRVLDFGIAKLLCSARALTVPSALMGTPLFMAPEQTEPDCDVTPATDVWALGLIVYRALTGQYFWRSARGVTPSVTQVLREVLFDALPTASERAIADDVEAALPPGFDGWFARCVARDPNGRFPNGGEAAAALTSLLGAALRSESAGEPEGARGTLSPTMLGEPSRGRVSPRVSVTPAMLAPTTPMADSWTVPPSLLVERLGEDPTLSVARVGEIIIVRWWGVPTVQSVTEMGRLIEPALRALRRPGTIMPVLDAATPSPKAPARRELERVMTAVDPFVERVSYVIFGEGFHAAAQRGVITGLTLASPPRHSTKVYATVDLAVAALSKKIDTLRVRALSDVIEAYVRRPMGA